MAEPDDKVKKLQDIKTQNQLAKIQWNLPPREPEYGYAMPLSNPTGTIATLGTALAALPIISDPQGAYETAQSVMNSVRGAIGGAMLKAGAKVSGTYVPEERRLTSNKLPSDNNDDKNNKRGDWRGFKPLSGYDKHPIKSGIRDILYLNYAPDIISGITGNIPDSGKGWIGRIILGSGDKPVERNDATVNNGAYPIERTGLDAVGNNIVWTKTKEGKDTLDVISKRPDYNGLFDN